MLNALLAIAAGAVLGAWARWGLGFLLGPHTQGLALGTLAANWLGAYLIGVAVAWFAAHPGLSPEWRLFLITGLLGSLTTFSTFSAEIVDLLQRQHIGWALTGIALHLFGSLAMTGLGILSVRALRGSMA